VVEAATHVAEVNMAVSKKNNANHKLKKMEMEETNLLRMPSTISLKLPVKSPGINSNTEAMNSDLNMTIIPNPTGTSKYSLLVTNRTPLQATVIIIEEVS